MLSRCNIIANGCRTILKNSETLQSPVCTQFVRWRKRRWAPKAPSKEFYVRVKPEQDPGEKEELTWRYRQYKNYMKSLRAHLMEKVRGAASTGVLSEELQEYEAEQFRDMLEVNEQWNEDTKKVREARFAEQNKTEQEEILRKLLLMDEEKQKRISAADERVRKEQEAAKFFIPEEKMEEEIEKALDVTFNYNFAMDLEGNRHIERPDFSTKKSTAENSDDFAPRLYGEVGGDQNRSEAEAS